jgi:RecA/RadA recombinase
MTDFRELMKATQNDYASIVEDGIEAGDIAGFIDTGSLSLNALFSGSIFGGIPSNKVVAFAGEPSTGKTFYAINVVKQFLHDNPDGAVFYFESESAISKDMMAQRGVPIDRCYLFPVETVQEFRTQALRVLDGYLAKKKDDRKPLMLVLDSLGNLSTTKEMEDIKKGLETRDMTRAQLIRGAFRTLTLKLGKANVAMLVTNHVYANVGGYGPAKRQGGGDGLQYAASQVVFLSKRKERDLGDEDEISGVIVTARLDKSRLTKEDSKVETLLYFDRGLDRYYGLLELAEKFGVWKKISTKYDIDGKLIFGKTIRKNPAKYFTQEVLERIDAGCKDEFLLGKGTSDAVNGTSDD